MILRGVELGRTNTTEALFRWKRSVAPDDGSGTSAAQLVGALTYGSIGVAAGLENFAAGNYALITHDSVTKAIIDIWIKPTDVSQGHIFANWDISDTSKQAFRCYLASGKVVVELKDPGSATVETLTSFTAIQENRETHLRVIFTWTTATANSDYIFLVIDGLNDGDIVFTGSATPLTNTGRATVLGSVYDSGSVSTAAAQVFQGAMGELRIDTNPRALVNRRGQWQTTPIFAEVIPVTRRKIGLIEMTIGEALSTGASAWTLSSGVYTQVTQFGNWTDETEGDDNENSLFVDSLKYVSVAGTTLTEAVKVGSYESIASTDNFKATPPNKIQIGRDPTDYALIFARYRHRMATFPLILSDTFVRGRIIRAPRVTRSASLPFDRLPSSLAGDMIVANDDRLFDQMASEDHWRLEPSSGNYFSNEIVISHSDYTFYVGGDFVHFGDWLPVYKGLMSSQEVEDENIRFKSYDINRSLLETTPVRERIGAGGQYGGSAGTDSQGDPLPIIAGRGHVDVAGLISGLSSNEVRWADHAVASLYNVRRQGVSTAITVGEYTVDLSLAQVTFSGTVWNPDDVYLATVSGLANTDFPCEFAHNLMLNYGNLGADDFDAGFDDDDTGEVLEIRMRLGPTDNLTFEQILRTLRDCRFLWVWAGGDGKWRSRKVRSDDSDPIDLTLKIEDLISISAKAFDRWLTETATVKVMDYAYNPPLRYKEVQTLQVGAKYGVHAVRTFYDNHPSWLKTVDDGKNWLGQLLNLIFLKSIPLVTAKTTIKALDADLLNRTRLNRDRDPMPGDPGATYPSVNWRILEWELNPDDWSIQLVLFPEEDFPIVGA